MSIQRGEREPDEDHPFGHGKERFFWSFLAAVLIFLAGAVFSVGQGILELVGTREETSFGLVYGTLPFAFVAEGISLIRAVRQTRADARRVGKGWREYIRESTEPTSKTVVAEDTVAVLGVLVAAVGVALHQATGSVAWDAGAAIVVGLMLVYVAYVLGRNFKDLLIGAGARPEDRERISRGACVTPRRGRGARCADDVLGAQLAAGRGTGRPRRRPRCRCDRAHRNRARGKAARSGAGSEVFLDPTPR